MCGVQYKTQTQSPCSQLIRNLKMATGKRRAKPGAASCPEAKHPVGVHETKEVVGRQGGEPSRGGHVQMTDFSPRVTGIRGVSRWGGCDQTGILREFAARCVEHGLGWLPVTCDSCHCCVGEACRWLVWVGWGPRNTRGGHVGAPWGRTCCQESEGREPRRFPGQWLGPEK